MHEIQGSMWIRVSRISRLFSLGKVDNIISAIVKHLKLR